MLNRVKPIISSLHIQSFVKSIQCVESSVETNVIEISSNEANYEVSITSWIN